MEIITLGYPTNTHGACDPKAGDALLFAIEQPTLEEGKLFGRWVGATGPLMPSYPSWGIPYPSSMASSPSGRAHHNVDTAR